MVDVADDAPQEFWRPPAALSQAAKTEFPALASPEMAQVCDGCGSEFMIQARFCHSCGMTRKALTETALVAGSDAAVIAGLWVKNVARVRSKLAWVEAFCSRVPFPSWLRYLHFHEIKRLVGLPTGSLIAFFIGLGCIAGAVGVSAFFKASNLGEFQAIQMWRIEWLLGATAAFVAGILLKKSSDQ